uniref:Allatostatins MIP n=1 Tax=Stomoxys calcitrans TaxID=35570 RepID=A0A1I8PDH1_STOCA
MVMAKQGSVVLILLITKVILSKMAAVFNPTTHYLKHHFLRIQVIVGFLVFSNVMATVFANAVTPEIPTVSDNESEFGDMMSMESGADEKRSGWQSLQGSWGKRSNQDFDANEMDTEHILPVLVTGMDPRSKLQLAYLTNAATLEHLANTQDIGLNSVETNDLDDSILNEKRAWKNLNVAWGKRRNGPTWNKFRGAWGKREPNWNNLKGMWGKRASKDWQKLHGGWGKRSQQYSDLN